MSIQRMPRRALLKSGSLLAGLPFLPVLNAFPGVAAAAPRRGRSGYGPIVERPRSLLHLPAGFNYYAFSPTGARMSDGNLVPGAHDGMRAFSMPGQPHIIRLVRNHELGGVSKAQGPACKSYDPTAPGAVTVVDFDTRRRKAVRSFLALSGTIENCAGGYGGRKNRSWLSCEESTEGLAEGYAEPHGYVFEVPADIDGLVTPVPLKAMGRFTHEAAERDPRSGIVYLTEDEGPDGFYRFLPNDVNDLTKGGTLWMLAVDGQPQYDTATGQAAGVVLKTHWVQIDDPDPEGAEENPLSVLEQGVAKGAATFAGLEGLYVRQGHVFFSASDGGDAERGQIWRYTPIDLEHGEVTLLYESAGRDLLDALALRGDGDAFVVAVRKRDGPLERRTDDEAPQVRRARRGIDRKQRGAIAAGVVAVGPERVAVAIELEPHRARLARRDGGDALEAAAGVIQRIGVDDAARLHAHEEQAVNVVRVQTRVVRQTSARVDEAARHQVQGSNPARVSAAAARFRRRRTLDAAAAGSLGFLRRNGAAPASAG
jgi:hypothetical protein